MEKFDSLHSGHSVQIVNEEKLGNKREWKLFFIKIKSEEEKEEVKMNKEEYRAFKRSLKQLKDQKLLDFHLLAKEKLKNYITYINKINYGDYDPLINCLIYGWGSISVAYNEIKNFEQEPYENILSANLRNKENKFWRITNRNFYFSLKIFKTVLNIKEQDIFVAFPPLHKYEKGWDFYKSPIKIFSEKTDFIIYLK